MKNTLVINSISFLLLLLFGWVAADNIRHFDAYIRQMQLQVFSPDIAMVLAYAVPASLLLTFILISIPLTRMAGLWSSSILLFAFTTYNSLVVLHAFRYQPCACISVIKNMSWSMQHIFTLTFLLLSLIALILKRKEVIHKNK